MAATDATPLPRKNVAFRLTCPILDNTGQPVPSPAGLDSEISKDGAAFADCTNEWTEIGTSGIGYLDLTATEMNADTVVVQIKSSTTDSKTSVLVIYPDGPTGIAATLAKLQAAVYDSASASGAVLTLSNGATQTVTTSGRVTA